MEQPALPSGTVAGRGSLGEASSPWEHLRSPRPWLPRRIWDRSPAAGDEQRHMGVEVLAQRSPDLAGRKGGRAGEGARRRGWEGGERLGARRGGTRAELGGEGRRRCSGALPLPSLLEKEGSGSVTYLLCRIQILEWVGIV